MANAMISVRSLVSAAVPPVTRPGRATSAGGAPVPPPPYRTTSYWRPLISHNTALSVQDDRQAIQKCISFHLFVYSREHFNMYNIYPRPKLRFNSNFAKPLLRQTLQIDMTRQSDRRAHCALRRHVFQVSCYKGRHPGQPHHHHAVLAADSPGRLARLSQAGPGPHLVLPLA